MSTGWSASNVGDGPDLSPDDAPFGGTTGCLLSCIHALAVCQKSPAVSPKLKVTVCWMSNGPPQSRLYPVPLDRPFRAYSAPRTLLLEQAREGDILENSDGQGRQ